MMTIKEKSDVFDKIVRVCATDMFENQELDYELVGLLWEKTLEVSSGVFQGTKVTIEPETVAVMLAVLRLAQLAKHPESVDCWADLASIAAHGGEIGAELITMGYDRILNKTVTFTMEDLIGAPFNPEKFLPELDELEDSEHQAVPSEEQQSEEEDQSIDGIGCVRNSDTFEPPEIDYRLIGLLWEKVLMVTSVPKGADVTIEPETVVVMLALLKVAKLAKNPVSLDCWSDLASIAARGGEIGAELAKERAEDRAALAEARRSMTERDKQENSDSQTVPSEAQQEDSGTEGGARTDGEV